jgi:predicted DNA-binding transcriptional regulator AlpA
MSRISEVGFLRLYQIIGNPKAIPPIQPIIPVKKSCWWAGVKSGRFPQSYKLSSGITAWRIEDIRSLVDGISSRGAASIAATGWGQRHG